MLLGIMALLTGLLIIWLYSTLLGGAVLIVGVILVGRQYTNEKPEFEHRDYSSSAPTYDLRSNSRR